MECAWWLWAFKMASAPAYVAIAAAALIYAKKAFRAAKDTADATKDSVSRLDLSLRVDSILRLNGQFRSPEMRRARAAVGRAMRDRAELPDDVEDVLDFFDDVALLLKREALDEEMTWAFFFAWLSRYVLASEAYVIEKQRDDPAVWRNVRPLFDRLLAVEETHTHHGRDEIIASTRRGFTKWFEGEADLAPV